jgi:hypothetical protein
MIRTPSARMLPSVIGGPGGCFAIGLTVTSGAVLLLGPLHFLLSI